MKQSISLRLAALALAAAPILAGAARAEDAPALQLVLQDHHFSPAELRVPANQPLQIQVLNKDESAEEFESSELKIEKVIPGGKSGIVRIRALPPGTYKFVGEYHEDIAKGVLIAE